MTDEQAKQIIAIQIAQTALLEAIVSNLGSLVAINKGQMHLHNWDRVRGLLKNAQTVAEGK